MRSILNARAPIFYTYVHGVVYGSLAKQTTACGLHAGVGWTAAVMPQACT